MRPSFALLFGITLALGLAGDSAAQDEDALLNERTKVRDGATSASTDAAAPRIAPDLQDLARRAAALADAGGDELPEARRLLGNLRADARFEEQPVAFQRAVVGRAGFVEMNANDDAAAEALFRQAIALEDSDPDVWYWLSWVQSGQQNYDDAARSLAQLFRRWPELADNIEDNHIGYLGLVEYASQDARTELLQAIFDSGWKREPLGGASHYHYQLALVRAKEGDVQALRRIVPRITAPVDIVRLLADKRFDAVVDASDPAFDPVAAAERRLKALQQQLAKFPDRLAVRVELQAALMSVGRFEEVITLADDAEAAIAAAPEDKPAFVDMDQRSWLQDRHSTALKALGRQDEAVRRLVEASGLDEEGQSNVSQTLNLASLYASLARYDDALAATARVGSSVSPFGEMVKASIEHLSYRQKGDTAAAERALAYLREHRADAETIYVDALVDAGDLDAAARELIAQLASEDERADVLYDLQEFKRTPTSPGHEANRQGWEKVRERADVQAALDKVGRRLKVELYHPY